MREIDFSPTFVENLGPAFICLLGLGFVFGMFAVWIKRRNSKRRYAAEDDNSAPIEGTEQDRLASESQQSVWSENLRVRLAKTHEIVGRLNTIDGYTETYVEDLLNTIRHEGISAEFYFQETSPIGVGASMIERHGDYEIFVERDRAEEAISIIQKFRALT